MNKITSLRSTIFFFLLFLSSLWFLSFVGRTILSPVLPLIEDEFPISHAKAGSILIFLSVGYGISIFFSDFFREYLDTGNPSSLSLLVTAHMFSLILFVKVFAAFYLFSFIIRMATGVYIPALNPLSISYYNDNICSKGLRFMTLLRP